MKKALRKDFWMEIRKSKARFISIFCIVALGVAFFSGIQATSPDMRKSGDAYFDEQDLMDIKVMGSMGLTEKDILALNEIDGVESAEGAFFLDVLCGDEGAQKVLRVESVNETVNRLAAEEGQLPQNSGECFLDMQYAKMEDIQIGDTLYVRQEEDNELLLKDSFTVVGIGSTPLYISTTRGNTNVGSGEISGFAYVLPEDFDQEVFTQAYLRVRGAEGLTSYTDAYDNLVDKIEKRIENISDAQCQIRLEDIVTEAQAELDDARKELEEAKADADKELADALKEIQDGEKELEDGRKELEDGRQQLKDAKAELEDGKRQIADAWAELDSGRQQLASARQQVSNGRAQLNASKKELEAGWTKYNEGKAEYEKGAAELQQSKKQIADAEAQIAQAKTTLETKQAELDAAKNQVAEGKVQAQAAITELTAQIPQVEAGIAAAQAAEAEIPAKQAAADAALAVVSEKQAAAAAAQAAYDAAQSSYASAQSSYDTAQAAYAAAQAAYTAAQAEFEAGVITAEALAVYEQAVIAAQSEAESANAVLAAAQGETESANAALAAAQSEAESANAVYGTAQAELAYYQELAGSKSVLEENLAAIYGGIAQAEQSLAELNAAEAQFGPGQQAIDQGWAELAKQEAALAPAKEQIAAGEKELAAGKAELDASYQQLAAGRNQINASEQQLNAAEAEIAANEKTLAAGEAEIIANEQTLADGEVEIAENETKLADAEKELKDGEKELEDGKKEYEDGKKEAEEEIADAEKEIEDAQKEIDDLEVPEWYISDRGDLPEYADYGDNANRIRSLGKVFPVIFFLVAALISLTTMTRMVEEQRTQIGTLKALGYGKYAIASKFLNYAFLATIGGSILGFLIGEKVIPYVIIAAYGTVYKSMAVLMDLQYQFEYALIAAAASIICTVGATLFSCYKVLMETPASLMRPPAPKEGKRVLIERIGFLWRCLNFTWKSSLRNLFRYKKRLFMTIFGISGSMGLMLVGFGIQDSIADISAKQFVELQHYDGTIISDEEASEEERLELQEYLAGNEKIERYTNIQFGVMEAPREKSKLGIYVYVPENLENFPADVSLRDRMTGEEYYLSEKGAVISEKTGKLLNLQVGDLLTLEKDEKLYQVPVTAVTENYMAHYAYMTPNVYKETFGEDADFSDVVFTMKEEYKDEAEDVGLEILEYPAALSISYSKSVQGTIDRMLNTLGSVIIVLIVSAGLLAFVVLYNLNNINITERQRELATLKVLGFFDGEVSSYVFRENVLLTIFGIAFGAGLGAVLHRYVILTVEVDIIMFGRNIAPSSYLYCALFTVAFSMIINWIMHRKLKKIDMVESLKSVE